MTYLITGSKGGGGGSTPVVASDTLFSYDTGFILDAISEGQIVGLVNGLQSVFLNDTPVQNADGSYNFLNLSVYQAYGTQHQQYIPSGSDVESTTPVGVKITVAAPVVRTITDANANSVRVILYTPALFTQDSSGNVNPTSVAFQIWIQTNGGGFVQMLDDAFSGKASSRYDRAYSFPLTGTGPWDIKVVRLTADSNTVMLANDLWVDSIVDIINTKLSYPNTALIGMQIDARAFQSIPKRSYDIQGLVVQIPSNYNPTSRTYTGLWDGTFITAWTDNPAWCYYDLLTSTRYGLGNYLTGSVDKWGLYAISQYCDALVPDGFGGTEPRFRMNCYLASAAESFQVINHMASVFRSMCYWGGGMITAVQDAPGNAMALFTQANVIEGNFSYSGASRKAMHTVALVTWNDPLNNYLQAIEYVSDDAAVATYGIIQTQVVAFGCTSRGQAHRVGQWLLYSEKAESEVVVFKASMDTAFMRPGMIFQIQDAHRTGSRFGGRLISAGSTASLLLIDSPIIIVSGVSYSVSVMLQDGTIGTSNIFSSPGSTVSLNLLNALPSIPLPNAIWAVAASNLAPTSWRSLSVSETAKNEYEVTAIAHDSAKYAAIESGIVLQPVPVISLPGMPAMPASVTISADFVLAGGVVRNRMNIDWPSVQYASSYTINWRQVPGNWARLPDVYSTHAEMLDPPVGQVEVSVSAANSLGVTGVARSSSATLTGKTTANVNDATAAPAASVTPGLFMVQCAWTFGDLAVSQGTEIWWSATDNQAAAVMLTRVDYPATHYNHVALSPGQTGFYWFRVISMYGNLSPWFPLSATAGLPCGPTTSPSVLLAQLNRAIDVGQLASSLNSTINSASSAVAYQAAQANTYMAAANALTAAINTSSSSATSQVGAVQAQVNSLVQTAPFSATTAYTIDQLVTYLGNLYECIVATTGNLPTNTTYWKPLGNFTTLADAVANANAQITQINYVNASSTSPVAQALALAFLSSTVNDPATGVVATNSTLKNSYSTTSNMTTAITTAINSLSATVGTNLSNALNSYATNSSINGSIASYLSTLSASGVNGLASVISQSQANYNSIGNINATSTLRVAANGAYAAMQMGAASGSAGSSSQIAFTSDKFVICHPDGTGITPIFTALTLNGAPTVGINGNLIVTGSLSASSINLTGGISALSSNIGSMTAGVLQSADGKMVIDLNNKFISMTT